MKFQFHAGEIFLSSECYFLRFYPVDNQLDIKKLSREASEPGLPVFFYPKIVAVSALPAARERPKKAGAKTKIRPESLNLFRSNRKIDMKKLRLFLAALMLISLTPARGQAFFRAEESRMQPIRFTKLSAFEDLPSEEVTQILQDSNGYIWMATNSGFCRYDGYRIRTYKDNLFQPELLTSNAVKCLAEDTAHRLWIGTDNGLNLFDLTTGHIRKIEDKRFEDKVISTLYAASDGSVWIGMDDVLYHYLPETDVFVAYDKTYGEGRSTKGVKTMLEDSRGRLWAGTWAHGYFRYDKEKDTFIPYPFFGSQRSVHVLFEDSRHTLWAGTWNDGLYRLEETDRPATVRATAYRHIPGNRNSLADDIVYCVAEDTGNHTLWIGTRSGLSLLDLDAPGPSAFTNYLPDDPQYRLPYNELNTLMRDRSGMFWLGMMGGGVYSVNMRPSPFRAYNLESVRKKLFSSSVRSLLMDADSTLWMGVGSYGLMIQRKEDPAPVFFREVKGLEKAVYPHTVNCFLERKFHPEIWMGTWGNGIMVYHKDTRTLHQWTPENAPWLSDRYVFAFLEDHRHNLWIGGRSGLSVLRPDGTGENLTGLTLDAERGQTLDFTYHSLLESRDGNIWMGTNHGIVRLSGEPAEPGGRRLSSYCRHNGRLASEQIQCLLEDRSGRLWAGSEGGGLYLYDPRKDAFEQVNHRYGLLADAVLSMQEDPEGNLWMGTNSGLVHLMVASDAGAATSRIYTTADGLLDNIFIRNAFARTPGGEFLFGGHNGYIMFRPEEVGVGAVVPPVAITDISIFNTSLNRMPLAGRKAVSEAAPDYTQKIRLAYDQNNFSIEFSSLSFVNPSKNKYAYKLDGYDAGWQYTGASNRVANYNSLAAGTYVFHLKGSNENGLWSEAERTLKVEILPPPWRTAWAYAGYALLFLVGAWLAYRLVRNRMREKQGKQLEAMERAKAEEVNHAKLQFFTNITHEFLTPLTILSASLDDLKRQAPRQAGSYAVMSGQINRLIRLIQQILEFRKAETGNLKLRVSEGDVAMFISREVEAFRPLMKKKRIHFALHLQPESFRGYFDSDKLDKILYNLLSNASKYNREEGTVEVDVRLDASGSYLMLSVKDDGEGIPPEAMKNLFKRFYEGDYRRFRTIGTGIGLSLTHDLVTLYGGTIRVESEVGKGSVFIVTLPVARAAFREEQIDEPPLAAAEKAEMFIPEETAPPTPEVCAEKEEEDVSQADREAEGSLRSAEEEKAVLLLVEDNEDLLRLMVNLLSRDYRVLTALDGEEALQKVSGETIDLIVSDVMMPVMDGIEFCKRVKSDIESSHIPLLLLTARNGEEDRMEAYESGADAFLSKPFNLSLLHARIRNLLHARRRVAHDFKKQLVFETRELNYTSLDEDFLQRAVDCVQRHLDDPDFDQAQFILEMATSKSTLYKKLKSLTGLNTSAFIRNIRLKAACRIMAEKKRIRISELAYAVGFNDPKYFSSCFKKEFGLLPGEYMEKYEPEE